MGTGLLPHFGYQEQGRCEGLREYLFVGAYLHFSWEDSQA
jgi:hypothetical protein